MPTGPKSHILFHKNGSLRDFYIMTLLIPLLLHIFKGGKIRDGIFVFAPSSKK
jgi:hypothetical protein